MAVVDLNGGRTFARRLRESEMKRKRGVGRLEDVRKRKRKRKKKKNGEGTCEREREERERKSLIFFSFFLFPFSLFNLMI